MNIWIFFCCLALLLQAFAIGMKLKYSSPQLLTLNNRTIPTCIAAVKELGLLRRPRYIHKSSHQKFVYHRRGCFVSAIPSIWTTVARLLRHQSSVVLDVSNTGNTARSVHTKRDCMWNIARSLHIKQDRKCGVNFSLLWPPQRFTSPLTLKIELFNTQPLTNKSSFIQDHIMDKGLDFVHYRNMAPARGLLSIKWCLSPWLQLPGESLQHWSWWWLSYNTQTEFGIVLPPPAYIFFFWMPCI